VWLCVWPQSDIAGLGRVELEDRGAKPPRAVDCAPPVASVQAIELIRPMRGGSCPWLVRCDDGNFYIVKFQSNPQHIRVLANEMFAGQLADLIQLPAAKPAFVEIPDALCALASRARAPAGDALQACVSGPHFGSRFPGDPASVFVIDFLPDRLLRKTGNLAFLGAFVFDKWTCNCDGRQMIFVRPLADSNAAYEPLLIDQGFCFNDGDWSFPDGPARHFFPRRVVYESVRGLESFEPFLSRIEGLKRSQLEACARLIPQQWCGSDAAELLRLAEALYLRRMKLRQLVIDAKNSELRPFPNWA
jgi:hypothetical protein